MRYFVLTVLLLQLVACGGATAISGPAHATAPGAQAESGTATAHGGPVSTRVAASLTTPNSTSGNGH
jgi:hypothetical protein